MIKWPEVDRRCDGGVDRPCPINPVQFGKMVQSVEDMAGTVRELSADVKALTEFKNSGKGILLGVALASGGVGAFATKFGGWILK